MTYRLLKSTFTEERNESLKNIDFSHLNGKNTFWRIKFT